MTAIWWIRRDLRLTDNPALQTALQQGAIIPVYVLDPFLLGRTSARRQSFLFSGLHAMRAQLEQRGSGLIIRSGSPEKALLNLFNQSGAESIYAEEDFTPYARARDARVAAALPLTLIHGQTVHHPLVIQKSDGTPYTVFTPFSKSWKSLLSSELSHLPAPLVIPPLPHLSSEQLPPFAENTLFPAGEIKALSRLNHFSENLIYQYAENRNRMDLAGTSSLSPYLHFGMLSMRMAVCAALAAMRQATNPLASKSAEIWLNELIWREFYISILYHFPHVSKTSFNSTLAHISWRDDEVDFEAWTMGKTGVPIVDAAMRQLSATGWMHNRARMIAASYLVKDLLINWQWGERWFMENLLDGDQAANNGGWQWIAGTGTDAAPYFRIFNPVLQSQKFDLHGDYIRKWVPELTHLSLDDIHAPWEKGLRVPGYPEKPIVDRAMVKDRTIRAYKMAKLMR